MKTWATWTLIVYLGYLPPMMLPAYHSQEACEVAGRELMKKVDRQDTNERFVCITGPLFPLPHDDAPEGDATLGPEDKR